MHRYELIVTLAVDEALECVTLAAFDGGRRSAALQQWSITGRPDKDGGTDRRGRIITTAAEHGWTLPSGRWPRFSKGNLTLTATPQQWETILSESTLTRTAALAHLAELEAGWHALITDAELPVIQVGKLVGFTRHRIYQLRQQ